MCSTLFCTFVCHCLARLQGETFYEGNVVLVHFFFTSLIFTLVDASISQGRPAGGGVGGSCIPVYLKKIRQNTQNSSKYTQNYTQVYFIPEIQRKWYTEYPYLSCNIPYIRFKKPLYTLYPKTLADPDFSFSHHRHKISCCSSNQKCLLCFFSLALALFLVELRWPVALLALFLFSKFVGMTIFLDNKNTEKFSFFCFRLYWLYSCLSFTRCGWPHPFPPSLFKACR